MTYARPGVDELMGRVTDYARSQLQSFVGEAVDAAAPKLKQLVIDTANEAVVSGAIGEEIKTLKMQAVGGAVAIVLATAALTWFLVKEV